MTEMTKAYVFLLDYEQDIKHLGDMGYPYREFPAPDREHEFRFWNKAGSRRSAPLLKLKV